MPYTNHTFVNNINNSFNRDNTFNLLTENKKKNERMRSSSNKYKLSDTEIKYSSYTLILINLPRKQKKNKKNIFRGNNRKTKENRRHSKAEIKHTKCRNGRYMCILTTRLLFPFFFCFRIYNSNEVLKA